MRPRRSRRLLAGASRLVLPFFLSVSLTSCLSYKEVELIDVTDIRVERMDARGVAVRVNALVNNPNNYRIHAQEPDVDLYLNDKFIGKGVLDSVITLLPKTTQVYSIPMHAELQGGSLLMVLLSGVLGGNEVKLAAKGTVVGRVGLFRKRFPFEFEETIDP
ncbi:MAG: LEA type 2 family protein [Flavobacteriales bacterium]|nr:LEA type 2 family protein [Flavobacteriales bacterium]HPF90509.1 LEA type 2 family protein [Flavobacteriales bacterium]